MSEVMETEALSAGEIIPPELLTPEAVNLLEKRHMEELVFHRNSEAEGWYRRAHSNWADNVGRWPAGQEKPKPLVPRKVELVSLGMPPAGWPQLPIWGLQPTDQPVCDELPDPTARPSGRQEAIGARMQYVDEYCCLVEDTMPMGHEAVRDGLKLKKTPKFLAPKNVLGEGGGTYVIVGKAA